VNASPYQLRAEALQRKLTRHELGCVLLHFATRRGFLSNRKTDRTSDSKGMLEEIGELQKTLARRRETLGQYLWHLSESFDHRDSRDQDRVRHRHTLRSMYEVEFEAIWEKQRTFYPELLTDELKFGAHGKRTFPVKPTGLPRAAKPLKQHGIHGLIFFQRAMYWPKSVVGQCDLTDESDPAKRCKRKRCPRGDRAAQRFRILQEVNNLKVLDADGERRLTERERKIVVDALLSTKTQTFSALRKKLGLREEARWSRQAQGT
jgi:CRISPR-associated endonuclease Csn1